MKHSNPATGNRNIEDILTRYNVFLSHTTYATSTRAWLDFSTQVGTDHIALRSDVDNMEHLIEIYISGRGLGFRGWMPAHMQASRFKQRWRGLATGPSALVIKNSRIDDCRIGLGLADVEDTVTVTNNIFENFPSDGNSTSVASDASTTGMIFSP